MACHWRVSDVAVAWRHSLHLDREELVAHLLQLLLQPLQLSFEVGSPAPPSRRVRLLQLHEELLLA